MAYRFQVKNFFLLKERQDRKIFSLRGNFLVKIKNIFIHVYDKMDSIFANKKETVVIGDDRVGCKNDGMEWLKEYNILRHVGKCASDRVDFVLLNVKCNKFFIQNCVRVNYKTKEIIEINLKKSFFADHKTIDITDACNIANDIIFLEDYSSTQEKERVNE